jgi:ribosome biogenesis protein NSA1
MEVWDLKAGKLQGALKGAGGSIRALALHPTQPLLASVGLDRYLRVHSTSSRNSVMKVYLKQQLTGVCWLPVTAVQGGAIAAAADAGTKCQEEELGMREDRGAVEPLKTGPGRGVHQQKKRKGAVGQSKRGNAKGGKQLGAGSGKKPKSQ